MVWIGMPVSEAGLGSSLYFAARTIGSFAGAFLLAKLSGARFLKYSMFVAIAAFVLLLLVPDMWSMFVMIVIVGLGVRMSFRSSSRTPFSTSRNGQMKYPP